MTNITTALLAELGVALIVFAVVSVTIERFARESILEEFQEHLDQISKRHLENEQALKEDVFEGLLGRVVRKEILQEAREAIFRPKFFREKLELMYVFENCPGDDKHIIVKKMLRYELHNISKQEDSHTFLHYIENVVCHDRIKDRITRFDVTNRSGKLVSLTEKELQPEVLSAGNKQ